MGASVRLIDSGGHVFEWLWWSKYSHVCFLTAALRHLNHPHFADGRNRDSKRFHNLLKFAQEISVRAASFSQWFPEPGILRVTEYFLKWEREGCQLFNLPIKGNKNNKKHQLSAFYKRKDTFTSKKKAGKWSSETKWDLKWINEALWKSDCASSFLKSLWSGERIVF